MGEEFDAIVVGGGPAGASAAYALACQGIETLIVERGNNAGAKNMTGGRIYAHCLHELMPDFDRTAPLERKVTDERIGLLTADGGTILSYQAPALAAEGGESYTVLRSRFDRWLFDQAEEAGATTATGIRVDRLMVEDGAVCGIVCGGDEIPASVVIVADGINSPLAQQAGLAAPLAPAQAAVGFKGVFELGAEKVTERFCRANDTEGTACLFAGEVTGGLFGGGFCYTNATSVSLGLVLGLSRIAEAERPAHVLFEEFCRHPAIAPLVAGGKLVEYSAHAISEAGIGALGNLYGDGVLVAGDAAGLCVNTGLVVRGMDFAVTSGRLAALTAIQAIRAADCSAQVLSHYRERLAQSYVLQDMELYRHAPEFLDSPRIAHDYPALVASILEEVFALDGTPRRPLSKTIRQAVKTPGITAILGDLRKGLRAL